MASAPLLIANDNHTAAIINGLRHAGLAQEARATHFHGR
jgi:hypothetical protein